MVSMVPEPQHQQGPGGTSITVDASSASTFNLYCAYTHTNALQVHDRWWTPFDAQCHKHTHTDACLARGRAACNWHWCCCPWRTVTART